MFHLKLARLDKAWHEPFTEERTVSKGKWLPHSPDLSVRPSAWNNSAPTGRIFMKIGLKICRENSTVIKTPTRITGTLYKDRYSTFMIIFC